MRIKYQICNKIICNHKNRGMNVKTHWIKSWKQWITQNSNLLNEKLELFDNVLNINSFFPFDNIK